MTSDLSKSDPATVSTEEYLGAVRDHLGAHAISPDKAGQHIEELAAHLNATGNSPIDEFGPPDVVAENLAQASYPDTNPWVRLGALAFTMTGFMLAIRLFIDGTNPVSLGAPELGGLLVVTAASMFGFSPAAARLRDQLFGVSKPGSSFEWGVISGFASVVIGAIAMTFVADLLIGDRTIDMALASWKAAIIVAAVFAPMVWWVSQRYLGKPKFPTGSPLRASNLTRAIRIDDQDKSGWRRQLSGFKGLVPLLVVLPLIIISGQLSDPYSMVLLVCGIFVAPAWMFWLRKSNTRTPKSIDS